MAFKMIPSNFAMSRGTTSCTTASSASKATSSKATCIRASAAFAARGAPDAFRVVHEPLSPTVSKTTSIPWQETSTDKSRPCSARSSWPSIAWRQRAPTAIARGAETTRTTLVSISDKAATQDLRCCTDANEGSTTQQRRTARATICVARDLAAPANKATHCSGDILLSPTLYAIDDAAQASSSSQALALTTLTPSAVDAMAAGAPSQPRARPGASTAGAARSNNSKPALLNSAALAFGDFASHAATAGASATLRQAARADATETFFFCQSHIADLTAAPPSSKARQASPPRAASESSQLRGSPRPEGAEAPKA
mmetsp:Transcript_18761/g.63367  ORF Transcript_18761/g.63367 Transcript_18761/m.63367 type:complete len:314 (-) Transcript_18761:104-1045(-)